jgi:hypothetical protein
LRKSVGRYFENLKVKRLLNSCNSILNRLFANSIYSKRQLEESNSEAKAIYRFLQNENISEADIIKKYVFYPAFHNNFNLRN